MRVKVLGELFLITISTVLLFGCQKDLPFINNVAEPLKVVITTDEEKEEGVYSWKVDHVTVKGDYPKSTLNLVNETLNNHIEEKEEKFASMKQLDEGEKRYYPYEYTVEAQVMTNDSGLFSIGLNMYQYAGGAHGIYWTDYFSFDLIEGRPIQLEEMFIPNMDYLDVIYQELFRQFEDNPLWYDNLMAYYYKDKEPLDFYIYDNKIYIYFPVYAIGPYVDGEHAFSIPYAVVEKYLSPLGIRVYS